MRWHPSTPSGRQRLAGPPKTRGRRLNLFGREQRDLVIAADQRQQRPERTRLRVDRGGWDSLVRLDATHKGAAPKN
jgi:hypothetical protein